MLFRSKKISTILKSSPVIKLSTIRMILSNVAIENLYLEQLDVTIAFLHDKTDEDIYMQQTIGFIVPIGRILCVS